MAEQRELIQGEYDLKPGPLLSAELEAGQPEARLKKIDRSQTYWGQIDLERLIGAEHPARAIWALVEKLKVEEFLKTNKSVNGRAGADRTDPRLLVSVWVYSLSEGVGSAREIARRMEYEPGLRWLSGGEVINPHTLSDFRVDHGVALDRLFAEVLAMLAQAGLMDLEQVTLDGTKIQAQASGASFRREKTLREQLEQAQGWVARLSDEEAAQQLGKRREVARRRAAEHRQACLEKALEELEQIRKTKKSEEDQQQARASRTEPEARIMKTSNGGYGPSYNLQTMAEVTNKILVSVELTQQASDQQQLQPALERCRQRQERAPQRVIVDGGYITRDNIAALAEQGIELIGPELKPEQRQARNEQQSLKAAGIAAEFGPRMFRILEEGRALECPAGKRLKRISDGSRYSQYRAQPEDCASCAHQNQCCPHSGVRTVKISKSNAVVNAFHQRMKDPASQQIYQLRGAVAEFPHAWLKDKIGLRKFHVRGMYKAGLEAKWAALTYNIQQWIRLCWRPSLAVATA
jgi:transposase